MGWGNLEKNRKIVTFGKMIRHFGFEVTLAALVLVSAIQGASAGSELKRTRQQFFRTRPQDGFVAAGGRAIISCVIGNLGGRVQWTKDGLTLGYNRELPGFPRYSVIGTDESGIFNLQILNATIEDEAEYECQVGPNGTNKAIRENSRLHVLLPPSETELVGHRAGSQLIVEDGAEVDVTCKVKDAKPKPDVIWYLGDVELAKGRREDVEEVGSSEERITVVSTIRFKVSSVDNLKRLSCEAHHPALMAGPLTASLSVFVQHPPGPPEIVGYSPAKSLKAGDLVSLECTSTGGNPLPTLTWYRNGKRVDSSYTSINNGSKNVYEFKAKPGDNNAVYSCQATNDLLKTPLVAEIRTAVRYGPESVKIRGPTAARTGDVLNFECLTSDSNPPVDIWWVVDGRAVQGNDTRTMPTETGGWVTRTNITLRVGPRDRTQLNIQCHAVNQAVGDTRVETHTVGILYPPEPPKIEGYTEGADTLVAGQLTRLSCSSRGGNPLATLTWYKQNPVTGDQAAVESQYTVGDNHAAAVLPLTPNITDNGAVYRCVVTSRALPAPPARDRSSMEASVKLTVEYPPACVRVGLDMARAGSESASIFRASSSLLESSFASSETTSTTTSTSVLRPGTEAVLRCSSCESSPPATAVWLLNGVPLEGAVTTAPGRYNGRITTNVLRLTVQAGDDGQVYTCRAENERGQAVDAITLSIAHKPKFPETQSPIEIVLGSSHIINMTADSNPPRVDYTWRTSSGRLMLADSRSSAGGGGSGSSVWRLTDDGVLNVSRAGLDLAGGYTVVANNSEGEAETKFIIDVLYPPKVLEISDPTTILPGESAVFECIFAANPIVYDGMRWYRTVRAANDATDVDEQLMMIGGQSEDGVTASLDHEDLGGNRVKSRLVLHNVTKEQAGRLTCVVDNGIRSGDREAKADTFLLVPQAPQIDRSSLLSQSAAGTGSTAELVCRATGVPSVTFGWRRSDGADLLATSARGKYTVNQPSIQRDAFTWESRLMIANVTAADYSQYECVARNAEGSVRHTVLLSPPGPPHPPTAFRPVNITETSVLLTWRPGFNGGGDQIFRVRYYALPNSERGGQFENPPSRVNYHDVYPMNSTSALFSNLLPGTAYAFAIQALNDFGESAFTQLATDDEASGEIVTLKRAGGGGDKQSSVQSTQPLVDGLTDNNGNTAASAAAGGNVSVIITITVGVCGTLLLLLSVVLIICLVKRRGNGVGNFIRGSAEKSSGTTSARSLTASSDGGSSCGGKSSAQSVASNGISGHHHHHIHHQDGLFNGSNSCYNDTMSEETMSCISDKSGANGNGANSMGFTASASLSGMLDNGSNNPSGNSNDVRIGNQSALSQILNEDFRPSAARTYLTDQNIIGGIYSVEQGREITGFTSSHLPLAPKFADSFAVTAEDTESQYADELRRQAYIQTLGDGYNISQIGSSVSYPNSPTAEYNFSTGGQPPPFMESPATMSAADQQQHQMNNNNNQNYQQTYHEHPGGHSNDFGVNNGHHNGNNNNNMHHHAHHHDQQHHGGHPPFHHHHHSAGGGGGSILGPSATLGRYSMRGAASNNNNGNGNNRTQPPNFVGGPARKSPFQVVIPGSGGKLAEATTLPKVVNGATPPPACSTPQEQPCEAMDMMAVETNPNPSGSYPLLGGLTGGNNQGHHHHHHHHHQQHSANPSPMSFSVGSSSLSNNGSPSHHRMLPEFSTFGGAPAAHHQAVVARVQSPPHTTGHLV